VEDVVVNGEIAYRILPMAITYNPTQKPPKELPRSGGD
jgi:hypothetical protein